MSQYTRILQTFSQLGYSQTSILQQHEILKSLDKINKIGIQFDRDVAQQLWDHTIKQRSNTIILRNYIHSIIQAQNVLKQHIQTTQEKLKYQTDIYEKQQLQADLLSFVNDHKILTQPFNLPHVPQSKAIIQSKANLISSSRPIPIGNEPLFSRTSQIFSMVPSQRQQSWSLKLVFILTSILILFELFIMFHKHHFFNLIGYMFLMLIFLQNYFDKIYMRGCILWMAIAVVLDFLWLIIHAENWWNPYSETQHSTIQTGYLRFSYFLVICTMLAKILIVILIARYFNNDQSIRKSVTLFSLSFKLDGRSNNNPITNALFSDRVINQIGNIN